jgi:hypothetical protein
MTGSLGITSSVNHLLVQRLDCQNLLVTPVIATGICEHAWAMPQQSLLAAVVGKNLAVGTQQQGFFLCWLKQLLRLPP